MPSFFSMGMESRIKKENILLKLEKLINWDKISQKLKGLYKKDELDLGGGRPYDPIKMFKSMLLGQWYSLSDPELEEALRLRIDFMYFTGLEIGEESPDETTLCRFRNRLVKNGLDKILFEEINSELESLKIKIKPSEGAILDATIIESSSRPRRQLEVQEDREEKESVVEISESKDPDSKWLKKGKKCYFGYKGFTIVDQEKGFIDRIDMLSANKSETRHLDKMTECYKTKRLYADKGYASKDNRESLKHRKIKDGIMYKKLKYKRLTHWQRLKNKLISKKRFIVERCFGTLKRKFRFQRTSYIGIAKVKAQLYWKSICFNLLKAVNMVKVV